MKVAVIIGSASDKEQMNGCIMALKDIGIDYEYRVYSAHRTPEELVKYVSEFEDRGIGVVIAGAGMSAALSGVVAAHTDIPVLGVPLVSGIAMGGMDSLLATAQMPPGIPVGCLAVGRPGATNAAYMAARILALSDKDIRERLRNRMKENKQKVLDVSFVEG